MTAKYSLDNKYILTELINFEHFQSDEIFMH